MKLIFKLLSNQDDLVPALCIVAMVLTAAVGILWGFPGGQQ